MSSVLLKKRLYDNPTVGGISNIRDKEIKNKRVKIYKSRGRQEVQVEQQLIVQNQNPTARDYYRAVTEEEALFPDTNFVPGLTIENQTVFQTFRGEWAFRVYGVNIGRSSKRTGGVPYPDFQTVTTNLRKGLRLVIEGLTGNPGATNGTSKPGGEPYATVVKFGIGKAVHNCRLDYRVGDYLMASYEAYTTVQNEKKVNVIQSFGTTDGAMEQRFLIQAIPISSNIVSVNQGWIHTALLLEFQRLESEIGNINYYNYLERVHEIIKEMGMEYFPILEDWARMDAILVTYHQMIRNDKSETDVIQLPSNQWYDACIELIKQVILNQKHSFNIYDTNLCKILPVTGKKIEDYIKEDGEKNTVIIHYWIVYHM